MEESKPIAWAFYNPDGSIRFIINSEERMLLCKKTHEGTIVPLMPQSDNNNNN